MKHTISVKCRIISLTCLVLLLCNLASCGNSKVANNVNEITEVTEAAQNTQLEEISAEPTEEISNFHEEVEGNGYYKMQWLWCAA